MFAILFFGCSGKAWANGFDGAMYDSVVRINAGEQVRAVQLALHKGMVVELPRAASEVLVSNPKLVDAVLQTARRVYLIGMKPGDANVIFTDNEGRQFLTLDISIIATSGELVSIKRLLDRLILGSNIQVEGINEAVVLTGVVRDPVDASRAANIVCSFLKKPGGASTTVSTISQSTESTSEAAGLQQVNRTTESTNLGGASGGGDSGGADDGGTCAPDTSVINLITVASQEQVLLKVSIVELERSTIKQFGINWDAVIRSGGTTISAFTQFRFPVNPVVDPITTLNYTSNSTDVTAFLHLLEEQNLARVLAEPNLTAISGETANFLVGGEFPIPVAQSSVGEVPTVTVEFKKFGVGLAFTPMVLSEGRISLKLGTEVSELSSEGAVVTQGITIPALRVRRADTTVELPSGGSLMIAGLISDRTRQAIGGYPGLKNLPVIGTLFRSRDFQKNETELVIIVTPYVVDAVARNDLVDPDKGFSWASDLHSDFLGQLNRVYGKKPERQPMGDCCGDVGFIVE